MGHDGRTACVCVSVCVSLSPLSLPVTHTGCQDGTACDVTRSVQDAVGGGLVMVMEEREEGEEGEEGRGSDTEP